jgi:hypothetical protein
MTAKARSFVPALRFDRLTPFYDPLLAAFLRERAWREALVARASFYRARKA